MSALAVNYEHNTDENKWKINISAVCTANPKASVRKKDMKQHTLSGAVNGGYITQTKPAVPKAAARRSGCGSSGVGSGARRTDDADDQTDGSSVELNGLDVCDDEVGGEAPCSWRLGLVGSAASLLVTLSTVHCRLLAFTPQS